MHFAYGGFHIWCLHRKIQRDQQIRRTVVHKLCGQMGRRSNTQKMLWTSYMKSPYRSLFHWRRNGTTGLPWTFVCLPKGRKFTLRFVPNKAYTVWIRGCLIKENSLCKRRLFRLISPLGLKFPPWVLGTCQNQRKIVAFSRWPNNFLSVSLLSILEQIWAKVRHYI